jgi:hypothetical protein
MEEAGRSVKPLTERQEQVVRLKLQDFDTEAIADEMGISVSGVYNHLCSQPVRDVLAAYRQQRIDKAAEILAKATEKAAQCLDDIVGNDDEDTKEQRMAAVAILDRGGLGPSSKTEVSGPGGAPLGIVLKSEEYEAERERLMAELEGVKK